ncbi:hypothetical protein H1N87_gp45 [Escherichia phage herni]|uniref:Lipoprotein n=1 Tax=Escherichia phage herni TaxID=2696404 RepID=A0A6B9XE70_9CAUD|nr:hypothetical protein H1N87_gp45 [Escherichia phage herni]EFW1287497.1 hypothetical protein [Shigella flexneri]QHR74778.1 hypothetical protein herni_45 [Escherichia phage herni]
MKRVIITFIALIAGCYLAYGYSGIVESIGGLIIFMAGGYAGYGDGFKDGKRYMLTGKKK